MRFAVTLAALLAALAPAAAADLTEAEIRAEIVGQSIDWWDEDGWHAGALLLAPDGRAEITIDTPMPAADRGHWTIAGDRLCTTWASMRTGDEKCYTLQRDAAGRFVTSGGNVFALRVAGV